MAHTTPVTLTQADNIHTIALNRPAEMNALTQALAEGFEMAVQNSIADPNCRVIVVKGTGKAFCAGGDLRAIAEAGVEAGALLDKITGPIHRAMQTLMQAPVYVICAVNGTAAGGGMGLALVGDHVIMRSDAVMTCAYTRAGLTPDCTLSWMLPRLVGLRAAKRLLLQNPVMNAQDSLQLGLVDEVTDADAFDDLIAQAAQAACKMAPGALALTKTLLAEAHDTPLDTHLSKEAASISAQSGSREGQEGIAAFLEKRPAHWGRDFNGST